ncbi:MAG: hypothetical protein ACI9JL_001245 [Paracoccaceae bacterium]|jgi:hypothetical protein
MLAKYRYPLAAIVLFLAERGLDVSGYTNLPLAVILWFMAGALAVIWIWSWLPEKPFRRKYMGPLILLVVSFVGVGTAVVWFSRLAEREKSQEVVQNLLFQKFALFWVEGEKHHYQIGVVTKFFNFDDKPYQINGIVLDLENWTFFPRGSYHLRSLTQLEDRAELVEDNYVKSGAEAYFKKLLPVKFDLTINGGDTPELVLRGRWSLRTKDHTVAVIPPLYSVHPRPLSTQEWDDLLKSQSQITFDDLYFKKVPERPPADMVDSSYLVFNADRSANIDNPYFAETLAARGPNGVIVFIRGKADVPTDRGWVMLGNTYSEAWADSRKLELYNSIHPPDEEGLPRAIGFFAGLENEMAGQLNRPLAAPTTRAADILEFSPDDKNSGSP